MSFFAIGTRLLQGGIGDRIGVVEKSGKSQLPHFSFSTNFYWAIVIVVWDCQWNNLYGMTAEQDNLYSTGTTAEPKAERGARVTVGWASLRTQRRARKLWAVPTV